MKQTLFLLVLATMLLLVGCSQDAQPSLNDTMLNDTMPHVNVTSPTEDAQEPSALPEQEPSSAIETPVMATLPGQLDILLDDIDVLKNTYGTAETHQLTMILGTAQYDKITFGTLSFKPLCSESARVFISINANPLYRDIPVCERVIELPLTKDVLQKGPNIIEFKNDIKEPYELVDIAVEFTYADNTTELLPADDHLFEPEKTAHVTVKDLGIVSMTNQVVRVFRLTQEELLNDIYLNFDTVHREGKLLILLNAQAIYEGTPKSTDHELLLPPEHLKVGENVLTFIGLQD